MLTDVVTKEDLEIFRLRLLADISQYLQKPEQEKKWIKSSEVRKLLKISAGTLQSLRTTGVLKFSKVGGGLRYNYLDVLKLLENK